MFQIDGEIVNLPYSKQNYGLTISRNGNAIEYKTDAGLIVSLTETGNLNIGLPKYYKDCVKGNSYCILPLLFVIDNIFDHLGLCGNNNDDKNDDLDQLDPLEYVQKWKIGDDMM